VAQNKPRQLQNTLVVHLISLCAHSTARFVSRVSKNMKKH